MAKLYFRYGAMGASKTANALMVKYNYHERGQNAILLKPAIDTRDNIEMVQSRIGLKEPAIIFETSDNIENLVLSNDKPDQALGCIIIDEAQFLTEAQVKQICKIVDEKNIPVICYGLRSDFRGNLFEGSEWLLALADSIEEIKTVCWCGKKAIINARIEDNKVVYDGDQIKIGGNESYISLCRKHWIEGRIHN